jgi:uncharacterized lipoprotein YajG
MIHNLEEKEMRKQRLFLVLVSIFIAASMILAGCAAPAEETK